MVIYELAECFLLIDSIAKQSSNINKTRCSVALARIQGQLINNYVLLIAKFFDEPYKRYPTVSIPSILKLLEETKEQIEITSIKKYIGIKEFGVNSLNENDQDKTKLIEFIANHFSEKN